MEQNNPLQKKLGIAIASVVIVGVASVTFAYEMMSSSATSSAPVPSVADSTQTPTQSSPAPTQTPVASPAVPPPAIVQKPTAVTSSTYKDGTYTATGSYMSPGGEEQVKVTLTLANDIVTSASVTSMAYDRTSQRYQGMFISGYKQYVVGKDISTVNLTYVSGSSLTPKGFDDALSQIESKAKA